MVKLCTSSPNYLPEYKNQKELSKVSEEEFNSAWKPHKYTWYQRLYQILCFIVFLGPIRAIIGLTVFVLSDILIVLIRIVIHSLKLQMDTGKRFCISIANFGFRFLLLAFGILHIKVNGKIDPNTRVIISNHTAYVDPMIISCIHPVTVVMKAELAKSTFLRYLMEIVDPVYIDRSAHTGASQFIIEHANNFKRFPVLIFPEATTINGNHLLKFHRGAFLTNQKVQPCCIRYWQPLVPQGWNQYAWTTVSLPMYLFEVLSMPFTIVSVDILDPITLDVEGKGNVDRFTTYAQIYMANHLGVKAITHSSNEIFMQKKAAKAKNE
ncbi:Ancient ubiquitous protein 1 [Tritrichomonas musculus]|uniref:Ancient ubiquitous protein 1 n=1 Tax=Tritrichomonas musculus TaxID=1915356 RepID=A0ABR2H1L7_9EUKA